MLKSLLTSVRFWTFTLSTATGLQVYALGSGNMTFLVSDGIVLVLCAIGLVQALRRRCQSVYYWWSGDPRRPGKAQCERHAWPKHVHFAHLPFDDPHHGNTITWETPGGKLQ